MCMDRCQLYFLIIIIRTRYKKWLSFVEKRELAHHNETETSRMCSLRSRALVRTTNKKIWSVLILLFAGVVIRSKH